jgi:hypothetical protein
MGVVKVENNKGELRKLARVAFGLSTGLLYSSIYVALLSAACCL